MTATYGQGEETGAPGPWRVPGESLGDFAEPQNQPRQAVAALLKSPKFSKRGAMEDFIYTLVRLEDWRAAEAAGAYHGSADDRRDGFLHFSTAAQLRASAAKHRAGIPDLLMVEVAAAPLGQSLKWEAASGGSRPGLFPHLYGALPLQAVRRVVALPLGADGAHQFPAGIP